MKLTFVLFAFLCISCIKEGETASFKAKFVIEGVIEEGEYPEVKITHNIPKDYVLNKEQLENLIVRWASVKVFNHEEEEFLTLTRNDNVFPYYYYVGKKLKGKAGEKYQLEVVYNDMIFRSETEIPALKPKIENTGITLLNKATAQPFVSIWNTEASANYRFFMKYESDPFFHTTSPKGFKAKDKTSGLHQIFLKRDKVLLDSVAGQKKYLAIADQVQIKVSNVSESSYNLWSKYSQQSLQFSFLNYSENFQGNIQGDAVGIWYGANSAIGQIGFGENNSSLLWSK